MTLQINEYRMMGQSLVRISDVTSERYTVEYVSITTHDGVKAISSGASMWHGEEKFTPVTDPVMVAAAKAFEANRRYAEMDKALDAAWSDVLKWNGVLQCLHEAEVAA